MKVRELNNKELIEICMNTQCESKLGKILQSELDKRLEFEKLSLIEFMKKYESGDRD